MAELRAYHCNKGDMLELVRFQKESAHKVAGAEELSLPLSSAEMLRAERTNRNKLGKMADTKIYSIPYTQVKKIANFKNQITGL